jgi:hypothetical protein
MTLSGRTMGEGQQPGPLYALTIAGALVQAVSMAWFAAQTGANSGAAGYQVLAAVVQGIIIGFMGR